MNVRIGAAYLLGLALVLGGCAGGPGPQAVQPQAVSDDDLPAWVLALPEGTPPRDTPETNTASLFLAQQQWEQALEAAETAIAADPTNALPYFQAGQAQLELGDYAAANQSFAQAEQIFPRYALDSQFFKETKWIEHYNAAVEAMPTSRDAAMAELERAHEAYQGRPEAMIQLGSMYSEDGRSADALDMFTQAREMIEGPVGQREEDPEVLAEYENNLEIIRFNQAQLLFDLERYGEAAEVYQSLVDENPDDLMAYSNLGASLVAAGDDAGAAAVYADLLQRPGLSVLDYNQIAIGAYNGDLFLQAAEAFGRAHEALPQNRDFIFNQAQSLYLAEEAYEELADVSTRLIEIDTHSRNARQFLIQALARLDRVEEAAAQLDALESLPFDLSGLQLVPVDGGYVIPGVITNRTADPGSDASLRFHFYDINGVEVGVQEVTYPLGQVEEGLEFEVEFPTSEEVIGYGYEVL